MNGFDRFWRLALERKSRGEGQSADKLLPQVDALWPGSVTIPGLSEDLRHFNFPGKLALLATGKLENPQPRLDDFIKRAAQLAMGKQGIIETNIQLEAVTGALEGILRQGGLSEMFFAAPEVRKELAEAVNEVAKGGGFSEQLSGELLLDLLAWKAAPALGKGRSADEVEPVKAAFKEVFAGSGPVEGMFAGEAGTTLLGKGLAAAVKELGLSVDEEEALTAVRLLSTGEFLNDAANSIATTLKTVPEVILNVPGDVISLPWRLFGLAKGIVDGLIQLPGELPEDLRKLAALQAPNSPALLTNTLDWLYTNGTFRSAAHLVWELTAPDNESLRLALILFARSRGVPVTEKELDAVRKLFDTDNPTLQPVLEAGITFLKERYAGRLEAVLQPLHF
ncbi:MAG: hypothetical protein HY268_20330 [Deltaproteobacteria bacterium]|nr:hypothetical protein [Deltaproteobacteria bacterium]